MLFNLVESNGMVYEFSDTFLNEWEKEANIKRSNSEIASIDVANNIWPRFKSWLSLLGFEEKDGVMTRNWLGVTISKVGHDKQRIVFNSL